MKFRGFLQSQLKMEHHANNAPNAGTPPNGANYNQPSSSGSTGRGSSNPNPPSSNAKQISYIQTMTNPQTGETKSLYKPPWEGGTRPMKP